MSWFIWQYPPKLYYNGERSRLRERGELLYDEMYFLGATGTPDLPDKYKIDDIFVMGKAEITPM